MEWKIFKTEWNGTFRKIWNMESFYSLPFQSMPWPLRKAFTSPNSDLVATNWLSKDSRDE